MSRPRARRTLAASIDEGPERLVELRIVDRQDRAAAQLPDEAAEPDRAEREPEDAADVDVARLVVDDSVVRAVCRSPLCHGSLRRGRPLAAVLDDPTERHIAAAAIALVINAFTHESLKMWLERLVNQLLNHKKHHRAG